MKHSRFVRILLTLMIIGALVPMSVALANGTETLGAPDIPIASGSGYVAAGTGLFHQPGTIDLTVPNGVTIKQVLMYWAGHSPALPGTQGAGATGDNQLTVNGNSVTGTLIGGPTFFFYLSNVDRDFYSTGFRADITALGLVSNGANLLTVSDLDFGNAQGAGFSDGAAVVVIFDDGSKAVIQVRDGVDVAFLNFTGTRQVTVPQTFTFAAAPVDRFADLRLLVGSVGVPISDSNYRPNAVKLHVDGVLQPLVINVFSSLDGEEWDTTKLDVLIPAGATSLTVEVLSYRDGTTNLPASLAWIAAGLSIPEVQPPTSVGARTIGFWMNHPDAWPVDTITIGGVTYSKSQAIEIIAKPPSGDMTIMLAKQLIATKLNVLAGSDSSCIQATITAADSWLTTYPLYSKVRGNQSAWTNSGEAIKNMLDDYNNGLLCASKVG